MVCVCTFFLWFPHFFLVENLTEQKEKRNEEEKQFSNEENIKMILCYTTWCEYVNISTYTFAHLGAVGLVLIRSWNEQLVQILV